MKISKLIVIMLLVALSGYFAQSKSTSTKPKTAKKVEETTQHVPPPQPPKDGVLIHISSGTENPQKVLMGLTMGLKMADDRDVFIFMDIDAVNVVLISSKSLELPKFESSKILIDKILNKGIKIAVCTMCLEAINKTQYDLMKGIKFVNKDDFFDFTQGRILTLNY
ncbi:MAG: peroxiredoxin [Bacteroidota bacterium]